MIDAAAVESVELMPKLIDFCARLVVGLEAVSEAAAATRLENFVLEAADWSPPDRLVEQHTQLLLSALFSTRQVVQDHLDEANFLSASVKAGKASDH